MAVVRVVVAVAAVAAAVGRVEVRAAAAAAVAAAETRAKAERSSGLRATSLRVGASDVSCPTRATWMRLDRSWELGLT
jgi:hypothetical protein